MKEINLNEVRVYLRVECYGVNVIVYIILFFIS